MMKQILCLAGAAILLFWLSAPAGHAAITDQSLTVTTPLTELQAPTVSVSFTSTTTVPAAQNVTATGTATFAGQAITLTCTNTTTTTLMNGDVARTFTCEGTFPENTLLLAPPGNYSVSVRLQTSAGETFGPVTAPFRVIIPDIPTLSQIVGELVADGFIAPQMQNPLTAKLDAAEAAVERGQTKTACNILRAFMHQVVAQTGKKIDRRAAPKLNADATALCNALSGQGGNGHGHGHGHGNDNGGDNGNDNGNDDGNGNGNGNGNGGHHGHGHGHGED